MDSYRQLQADRWRKSQGYSTPVEPTIDSQTQVKPVLIKEMCKALTPGEEQSLSIVAVDESGLNSIKSFLNEVNPHRTGVMFGDIAEDGFTVVVDVIYETAQDSVTGEPLLDARLPAVRSLSNLMRLRPVGILVSDKEVKASHLLRVRELEDAICHILLIVNEESLRAIVPTVDCFECDLTVKTSLMGRTHGGGLDGTRLQREIPVVKRTVNTIVHAGFYRLNRSNHTPTFNDARAFILARREKAKIGPLYLQLADYHLLLWIADSLGESTAERVVIAIHQEDDSLVEDLVELLLTSNVDL